MRGHSVILLGGLMLGVVTAAPAESPSAVRLPGVPVLPQPMPSPDAVVTLSENLNYVIDSDVECVVLGSPKGRLKITFEKGPLDVRGEFPDGQGVERRTYKGPFLYFVEPAADGACELLVIPKGGGEKDVIRRSLLCKLGPRPPPGPKPDPPTPLKSVAWVVVVEETGVRSVETVRVLGDVAYWKRLEASGVKWRFYDKDSADALSKGYVRAAGGVYPSVVLLDALGKNPATGGEPVGVKLPATTAGVDALVKGGP